MRTLGPYLHNADQLQRQGRRHSRSVRFVQARHKALQMLRKPGRPEKFLACGIVEPTCSTPTSCSARGGGIFAACAWCSRATRRCSITTTRQRLRAASAAAGPSEAAAFAAMPFCRPPASTATSIQGRLFRVASPRCDSSCGRLLRWWRPRKSLQTRHAEAACSRCRANARQRSGCWCVGYKRFGTKGTL